MSARYDAIVVGGGQNGLAAAARLAAAGRSVAVVERRDRSGGLAGAYEFHPGYVAPGLLFDDGLMRPAVAERLGLGRHGLAFRAAPPVLVAEESGRGVLLARDGGPGSSELSARDGAAYADYRAFAARLSPMVDALMTSPPPGLSPASLRDWLALARQGWPLFRLGRRATTELLRVAPMCVADFLNERFASPLLVEALAAPAVGGSWSGPWSAGTTTNLLLHEAAPGRPVAGGPPALVAALEAAARAAGADIRTGAEVARIRIDAGRAAGVILASGEELDAPIVVATCDPKRALLDLVPPGELPIAIETEFRRVRSRGTAAKLLLALAGPLELAARPGERFEAIRIGGGHVDELERAFDAIKYRRFSARPHLEVRVPTVAEPSLAPAGHEVVSIEASFAPYALEGGWSETRRRELGEAILGRLELHAPGVRSQIVAQELLTPADLESRWSVTGGQLHHVEPALDQLFVMRPAPSAARYATAVPGLFLGGSGSHGGGGVTCAPGLLAADAALARA
ncbi:MAG TPA: NAD(P)/FAD-dependent oxidoreductase [Thermoanaerobaculia bacterium]|nr:NAD(P)/FAD-dependent oxidoreductase [Thermoanaerobaculia bacterium]